MSASMLGLLSWSLNRDEDGYREYEAKWLVECTDYWDGPYTVMNASGLPFIGSSWNIGNDSDLYAYCQPQWQISPVLEGEPNKYWYVQTPFSTKPRKRCQDNAPENPLDEPMRLGGSFVKFTKEVAVDRNDNLLRTTSHEVLRGAVTEFDDNRPTVQVGMNLLVLPLSTFTPMIDTVNDGPMWGLSARMVKLSNATWTRQVYGTCSYYYTVDYEFECNFNTFDRQAPSVGSRCLMYTREANGDFSFMNPDAIDPSTGQANYLNPNNFIVYQDKYDNNTPCFHDSKGRAVESEDDVHYIDIDYYDEANFFVLGIPASL